MPVPHVRVEVFGTQVNGAEKWTTGFSTAPPTGGALAAVDALALTAVTLFRDDVWNASPTHALFPGFSALLGGKATQYEGDGTVRAVGEFILAASVYGGATTALPPQCSTVVSLRTPVAGARGRGRMYLPTLGSNALYQDGRLAVASRSAIASAMQLFLNDWNADSGTQPVGVASAVGGYVTTVTSIQVGDVIDTQRRRRDTLPESYLSAAITV